MNIQMPGDHYSIQISEIIDIVKYLQTTTLPWVMRDKSKDVGSDEYDLKMSRYSLCLTDKHLYICEGSQIFVYVSDNENSSDIFKIRARIRKDRGVELPANSMYEEIRGGLEKVKGIPPRQHIPSDVPGFNPYPGEAVRIEGGPSAWIARPPQPNRTYDDTPRPLRWLKSLFRGS